ncbi:cobalamin adenosyltransferase [Nitrincola sp.]|uniref:cobalamin adenosyltransferase n=1 Tax=Nitrincola sp. TaxID=1926584 RepID=UPI003A9596E0
MPLKPSKDRDELCYPFIHEVSALCDYEVLTDELCTLMGMACSAMPESMADLAVDLEWLQPLAFHANGSIRGRLALTESDLEGLKQCLNHYKAEVAERVQGFVLPRGSSPVTELHQARSVSKKAIRALVRLDASGVSVPDLLPRFLNLCCNLCFVLTQVVNQRRGVIEPEFISKSYAVRNSHQ